MPGSGSGWNCEITPVEYLSGLEKGADVFTLVAREEQVAPCHKPCPGRLSRELGRGWHGTDLAQANGASLSQLNQRLVVVRVESADVDVGSQKIDDIVPGVEAGVWQDAVPDFIAVEAPDQVIEPVEVNQSIEEHPVQFDVAIRAGATSPPEPRTVHLVVGAPDHGDPSMLELPEVPCNHIDLCSPALVQVRAGSGQLGPFRVGELALDAFPPTGRFIVHRRNRVPHERDNRALLVLPDACVDHLLTQMNGIERVSRAESEILAEYSGPCATG